VSRDLVRFSAALDVWTDEFENSSVAFNSWMRLMSFPLKGDAGWLVAIKAAGRRAERLEEGDCIAVEMGLH